MVKIFVEFFKCEETYLYYKDFIFESKHYMTFNTYRASKGVRVGSAHTSSPSSTTSNIIFHLFSFSLSHSKLSKAKNRSIILLRSRSILNNSRLTARL